ncbi:hypothetical protein PSACC_01117 [Paramicrosporidium saccamoebae]|uniref:Uncharacterized protein n=1 Tax=Paramicrosporidium saccamoebae TaxID=1246581 RepID=A0A2H9TN31_9FUNG|nr:hypothetical protein PSACC_01117 [Paramicrosporidium saccamoebae]
MAECEFQSRLLSAELDLAEDEMEVPKFATSLLEKAVHGVQRGIKEGSGVEKLLLVFQGKYQAALEQAFQYIPGEELLGLFRLTDTEETIRGPTLAQIVGLQTSYCKGVAMEMTGRAREALVPYSDVSDFCRRFPVPMALKTRGLAHFVGMAMYRYGMLCSTLTADPRPLRTAFGNGGTTSTGTIRGRLLYDAAVALRMFLAFMPSAYGTTRHAAALIRYVEALEGRFRGSIYRNTFDPEQYTFTQQTAERFSPETIAEDVVYCTQLLESLQPLQPASRHDAQAGSASGRVRGALARLARHGATESLVRMAKALFSRYAAEASTYGRLLLACAAARRHDEATQAGEIYVALGGREPSVLLVLIKSLLLFPSKAPLVVALLERHSTLLPTFSPLLQMRGLAFLSLQRNEEAVAALEAAVEIDDTDPQAHLILALAHFAAGNCRMAEQAVKLSLSIEENQPCAWLLFAAIKSAQKDFDTCLSLCNTFLENCTVSFVPMALLKTAVLCYLGLLEEAAGVVESLIGTCTEPSGPVFDRDGILSDDVESVPKLDPARFRARFYPSGESSTTDSTTVVVYPAQRLGLTMTSYKEAFPDRANQVLASKLTRSELFPEAVLPASDVIDYLRTLSILSASHSVLLAQQLWCTLGEIRMVQRKLKLAELCEHEAFVLNELDVGTYVLKGHIQLALDRHSIALQCFQLGLQMDPRNIDCLLGCAQCYLHIESPNQLHLALHMATKAMEVDPTNIPALSLCADLSRKLNLDRRAGELYERAMVCEETDSIFPMQSILRLITVSLSAY